MIVNREQFIPQFLRYIERRLHEELKEEGFESEMLNESFRLLTEHREHNFTKMRFPG